MAKNWMLMFYDGRLIRCPHCGHKWSVDTGDLCGEGEFVRGCPECDKEATYYATLSYTFRSPELGQAE